MFLLHVSTARFYSFAVLVTILLLVTQDAYSWDINSPATYTWGWPNYRNFKKTRYIDVAASSWGSVTYITNLTYNYQINCIKITDHARNAPKIQLSRWPPCYETKIVIISPKRDKIDLTMEIYYAGV